MSPDLVSKCLSCPSLALKPDHMDLVISFAWLGRSLVNLRSCSAMIVMCERYFPWSDIAIAHIRLVAHRRELVLAEPCQILPHLKPREFDKGAHLLGAHCEGPWLNASKRGAHGQHYVLSSGGNHLSYTDANLMQIPSKTSIDATYGDSDGFSAVKLVTLAPELPGSTALISTLSQHHAIVVSLGHSTADYDGGLHALGAGAKCLTHVFNAMSPLHHRLPGLAGLITASQAPFFSLIADGVHLHPASLTMAFRSNPERCILITDSVEMAGMPDGVYPGHAQVPHRQRKEGNKITIEGTETLVGSCCTIEDCVKNLKLWSGCSLAEAVRCATENVAELMGETKRGVVEQGRRADFVILDDNGTVNQTWIGGLKVFDESA